MEQKKHDIFISYRRKDAEGRISGRDIARILQLELERHPKEELVHYKVFYDYHDIKDGDFANVIEPAIRACKVFILVLSRDALSRCCNEDDWVRREIKTALEAGCKIVNVRPIDPDDPSNGFSGWPEDLPDELRPITKIEASEIVMGKTFEESIEKLEKERIREAIPFLGELSRLVRKGCEVRAEDLYFDRERVKSKNGFVRNRYFPRQSVDGQLERALLLEQRKYTVLLGAPGSGKSRAIFQLLVPQEEGRGVYALGALADKNVITVRQENVMQVFKFLKWMAGREREGRGSGEEVCYLLCDQVKDVFRMLIHNDDLYQFFDLMGEVPQVRMIVTSIPSAFDSFCERWKEYGRKPLEDDQITAQITIPSLSSDEEGEKIRNWIQNEWRTETTNKAKISSGESVGDYIPSLNKYRQGIVDRTYGKVDKLPFLPYLTSAIQIVETYRHDTALFLPILVARKNIESDGVVYRDFRQDMVRTINFLIANNVIWVTNGQGELLSEVSAKMFGLELGFDDDDDFLFDNETYPDAPISTAYSYGVNEIVWKHLEQEDAARHISNNSVTLLKDCQEVREVVRSAREFYRAIPKVSSLRRILPRLPRTDCYDEAFARLWDFVLKECQGMDVPSDGRADFLTTIGMLIGRAKNIEQVKTTADTLEKKGLKPNYDVVGELYSAANRLGGEVGQTIESYIVDIREKYGLKANSIFSLLREMVFYDLSFADGLRKVCESPLQIDEIDGRVVKIDTLGDALKNKQVLYSVKHLLAYIAKKATDMEQWESVFDLYHRAGIAIRRSELRLYFALVGEKDTRLQHEKGEWDESLLVERVKSFFANHSEIIGEEDCEGIYFYSAEFTQSFRDSLEIYKFYYHNYGHDNPRLISRIIRKTLDNEFQTALSFLVEVDARMKKVGEGLSIICFNNLIRRAPNIGEALGVIPYLSHIQEYTLACMLQVLKRRRIKDERSKTGWVSDPKIFYYAYSVVMRDEFFELRTSPFIIGLLFDLAITPKHEQFIRNIFISQALSSEVREDVRELRKSELIDYSTAIASMRIRKNYRNVKDIWQVFSTCRDYYAQKKMYITSELYSGMMKKIHYLCQHDSAELNQNLEHLQRIINEDWFRIVRDEYFLSTLYRFMPDKHILDDEGHICEDFKKDMQSSNIQQVKVLNCIMYDLRNHGFDTLWQFYEYIVSYYETHAKLRGLMPDYRTITYLLETVQTEEHFLKTDDAAKRWLGSRVVSNNIMYGQAYYHALKAIGRNVPKREKDTVATAPERAQSGRTVRTGRRDYRGETDDVINLALMDIYLYGSLTSTLFNQYLKEIIEIVKDIRKDTNMRSEVVKTCIQGTYWNLSKNLLEKHRDDLMFDVDSYVSLIKLSPDSNVARKWVKELARHREAYRFNVVACREIATSVEVSQCDIDLSLDCFEYWERIMNDIGYDPEDPTSASEPTEAKFLPSPMKDYDGYWATRYYHTLREMSHYCYTKARWGGDKDSLTFIKKQMEVFDQYGIPFPAFRSKGKNEAVDFREEVKLLSDEHLNP